MEYIIEIKKEVMSIKQQQTKKDMNGKKRIKQPKC